MTKPGGKRPKPHAMPYRSLEEIAVAYPELNVTILKEFNGPLNEYYDRDAVSKITGKSIPTLEMWASKGWLVPTRKYGNIALYNLDEIHELIETGEFPSQKDHERTA